jgi:hypothetical protein
MARNGNQIVVGAGLLYCAPIATTEPTSATATLDPAFREVGYTDKGPTFKNTLSNSAIEVAEEFYPVKYATTKVEASLAFDMSQATVENLALAINLGANYANGSASLEPPVPGQEVRVMLLHKTEQGAVWIFRQCINTSDVQMQSQKSPNVKLIPVTFNMEKPAGVQPWKVLPAAGGII